MTEPDSPRVPAAPTSQELERALRVSEARLRAVVESSPAAIWIYDGADTVLVNNALVEMTGYSREELLIPQFFDRVFEPADNKRMGEYAAARLRGESPPTRYEVTIIRADGERRVLDVAAAPTDVASRPVVVVTALDVTERKHEEQARHAIDAQLQQAQKLESLGVLAGGLAHDFNNLLVTILGNANLARSEAAPGSAGDAALAAIEAAAERAAGLTRQMLAYSGRGRFVVEPIDISATMRQMLDVLRVSIPKDALVSVDLAERLPLVEGDPAQVAQVAMNLITNASDALSGGKGSIRLATGTRDLDRAALDDAVLGDTLPPGRYVYLEVSDSGVGMDLETQQRIFDPFFTTKFTGRGLGLAAVHGIVRSHRGAIQVESRPGAGSSIRVLFPLTASAAAPEPLERDPLDRPIRSENSWTVLVVDDDPPVQLVARRMLEKSGHEAFVADSGEAGLANLAANPHIEAVLLDVTMPGIDGVETLRRIREARPTLPVLMMSGYNLEAAGIATDSCTGFLHKPFSVEALQGALAGLLGSPG